MSDVEAGRSKPLSDQETDLIRRLYRLDTNTRLYKKAQFEKGDLTPEQIAKGQAFEADRNRAIVEALGMHHRGELKGVEVTVRVELTLPPIPSDPRRTFKARIDETLEVLEKIDPGVRDLLKPPASPQE